MDPMATFTLSQLDVGNVSYSLRVTFDPCHNLPHFPPLPPQFCKGHDCSSFGHITSHYIVSDLAGRKMEHLVSEPTNQLLFSVPVPYGINQESIPQAWHACCCTTLVCSLYLKSRSWYIYLFILFFIFCQPQTQWWRPLLMHGERKVQPISTGEIMHDITRQSSMGIRSIYVHSLMNRENKVDNRWVNLPPVDWLVR